MTLRTLVERASNKANFTRLVHFTDFARSYLDFIADGHALQAEIVCQNEQQYRFWQYKEDGHFNITRPINSDLLIDASESVRLGDEFLSLFVNLNAIGGNDSKRTLIRAGIYTIQQCIGAALDAQPAGLANKARKINGDLFERLIQLLVRRSGVDCEAGAVKLPIAVDGKVQCHMRYQHDLILKRNGKLKGIGSVKTSSKDRIDKIFIDKFLFNKLTGTQTPHLAIFLNDVQRGKKTEQSYKVRATFLPGHFKGYTIKLNPLDGVYYCDIRPNMVSDPFLAARISTIDHFFCDDLWAMLEEAEGVDAVIQEDDDSAAIEE
jgi:hypothetical protein